MQTERGLCKLISNNIFFMQNNKKKTIANVPSGHGNDNQLIQQFALKFPLTKHS